MKWCACCFVVVSSLSACVTDDDSLNVNRLTPDLGEMFSRVIILEAKQAEHKRVIKVLAKRVEQLEADIALISSTPKKRE